MINMANPWATINTRLTRAILGVSGATSDVIVYDDVLIYDADEYNGAHFDLELNGLIGVKLKSLSELDKPKLKAWCETLESLLIYNKRYKFLDHDEYRKDPDNDFDEAQDNLCNGWVDTYLKNSNVI